MPHATFFDSDAFRNLGIQPASALPARAESRLRSGIPAVDDLLGGGLAFGSLSEWGMPFGLGGRSLILHFLARATQGANLADPLRVLWIASPTSGFKIFPPAWAAKGLELQQLHFVEVEHPVAELNPAFLSNTFRLIVLDAPQRLSQDELAFLCAKARANRQILLLLRNFFLSNRRGNIWAKLRFNCQRIEQKPNGRSSFRLEAVRGQLLHSISHSTSRPSSLRFEVEDA